MDELKFDVKAIASVMQCTVDELADKTGITRNHLKQVSAGNVRMLFIDAQKLSDISGISLTQIIEVKK